MVSLEKKESIQNKVGLLGKIHFMYFETAKILVRGLKKEGGGGKKRKKKTVLPIKVFLKDSNKLFLAKMLLHTSSFLEENDTLGSLIVVFRKVWSNRVSNT